jgi:TRAP-type C4-dicarboxylate transport system permease small subunit
MNGVPVPDRANGRSRLAALFVEVPAVIVLMVMAVHVVINAVSRRLFREPFEGTLELVQYWYMPVLALFGIFAAQVRGQHLAAELIYRRLTRVGQRVYALAGVSVCILVSLGFAWYGGLEALDAADTGRTAGALGLPVWPAYFFVPIVLAAVAVQQFISLVKGEAFDGVEDIEAVYSEDLEADLRSEAESTNATPVTDAPRAGDVR